MFVEKTALYAKTQFKKREKQSLNIRDVHYFGEKK